MHFYSTIYSLMIWLFALFLSSFTLEPCVAKNLREVPLKKDSRVRWVAPDKWPDDMPAHTKAYWNYEFSKSSYESSCSNDQLKIVSVYFWPGEKVQLPCIMCELAFVLNGKMKRWSVAEDITGFLESPQEYVASDPERWVKSVNNYDYQEDATIPLPTKEDPKDPDLFPPDDFMPSSAHSEKPDGTNEKKEPPVYFQRDGKLSILRASPASQGVYFCHDTESAGSTNLFYVVMAIVPTVTMGHYSPALNDGCGTDVKRSTFSFLSHVDLLFPSFNWRFHYQPAVRYEKPQECIDDPDWYLCRNETFLEVEDDKTLNKEDENSECTLNGCRAKMVEEHVAELNVAIELRWTNWTSCGYDKATQTRQAHCYLVREAGKVVPEQALKSLNWLNKLNSLFDHHPFSKEGINIHSSLLPSLIMKENKMRGCVPESTAATTFDDAWRQYILHTVGIRGPGGGKMERDSDLSFRLKNPFQACFGYERTEDHEILIGTYMVETRACP